MTAGAALVGVGDGTVDDGLGLCVRDTVFDGARERDMLREFVTEAEPEALTDWPREYVATASKNKTARRALGMVSISGGISWHLDQIFLNSTNP